MAAGFKTAQVNASDVPATLSNYPAYVDPSRLGITNLAEAQSVRVYADSGKTTEWAREIVSATEMHVKVPSLTSTTSIYVEWDGVSADYAVTDTYGRNAVWSDYDAVYHLKENTGTSAGNSTGGTAGTLTSSGLWSTTSPFGDSVSIEFDGANYISGPQMGTFANYSITTWRYVTDPIGTQNAQYIGYGVDNGSNRFIRSYYDDGNAVGSRSVNFDRRNATNNLSANAGSTGVWYHHVVTSEKSVTNGFRPYYNATLQATATVVNVDFVLGSRPLYLGALNNVGTAGNYALADNYISEFRLRYDILSANWITTEYNNQSDEAGFWGTWSDVGGGNTTNFFYMT